MSRNQKLLLEELAQCAPGKGMQLNDQGRRVAGPLVSDGLVYWIQGGPFKVYILTDKGRQWVRDNMETKP